MQRLATSWWAVAAGLLCAWLLFQPGTARAATFGNSSLSGPFGLQLNKFGTCPNLVVVVGVFNFDGSSAVTGRFSQYASDRGGAGPKASSGSVLGTYSVNSDGTGTMSLTSPKVGTFAFVIDSTSTSAERIELISTSSASWTCAMSGYAIQQ
ncbi:MAG TPA: hypothetical protein VNF49_09150 [Candidatus Binataceae bacterium]|nr:hypothetical protein [Candidatus Binataceae bacterium]